MIYFCYYKCTTCTFWLDPMGPIPIVILKKKYFTRLHFVFFGPRNPSSTKKPKGTIKHFFFHFFFTKVVQVLHFSLSKVLGILIYEKIETSGVPFHAAVVFSLGPDFIQVLAGFF